MSTSDTGTDAGHAVGSGRGTGLLGLKDRIEALGGTFSVHSPVGCGTTVTCELPIVTGGSPDAHPAD